MQGLELASHTGQPLTIDICFACQVFWFDDRESLHLSPASTLRLFRTIGESPATARRPVVRDSVCPRCGSRLVHAQDMQRTTKFQYRRCPKRHGRLTTFFDFLREKNFVRPLPAAEIEELRKNLDSVNCSNCGASIDLVRTSVCGHCGSPLSVLDSRQAEKLVAELQKADRTSQPVDPALPMRLASAKREVSSSFEAFERQTGSLDGLSAGDLVMAGLRRLNEWLK
jgi:hypothetical protein